MTHCNTPQRTNAGRSPYTTTHYNTLQHTAPHCTTLQHAPTHSSTLQHTATHWIRLGLPRERSRSRSCSPLTPRGGGSTAGGTGSQVDRAPVPGPVFCMKTARPPRQSVVDGECHQCGNLVYGHKSMCGWSLLFSCFLSCHECLLTAAHCNTLQHTATDCSTLQHTTAHCSRKRLPCDAVHCSVV